MPVCSAMPSRSARAKSLGIGSRYRSSRRTAPGRREEAGAAAGGGAAVATSGVLRGIRLRVMLPDPSSPRATAMVRPPLGDGDVVEENQAADPAYSPHAGA